MEGIDRLEKALYYIRKEINEEIPVQQLLLFLVVAKENGITQHAISTRLGMPAGSVSRNVKMLSQWAERRDGNLVIKGYNLFDTRPDIEYRNRMAVFLTPRGFEVLEALDKIFTELTDEG